MVDTNVIAYLLLAGTHTAEAQNAFRKDPDWAAPILWRSEFQNVLAQYVHKDQMTVPQALEFMDEAETLMQGREYQVSSQRVLALTANSRCSAYDCEFMALAEDLALPLVTSDSKLLKEFPAKAVALRDFAQG